MANKELTTFDVADYCNVSHRTVRQWILDGKLKSYRTPGKHSRVKREDFVEFLQKFHMPIPEGFEHFLRQKKRILVVDDDETMVLVIKGQLNPDGRYEMEEAFDGFSAGKKFSEFRPDLMTLDIKMPYLNGFEVLKEIHQDPKNKDVKIIVISGVVDKREQKKLMELGANDFLAKPFDRKELIQRVENLLARKP